LNLTPAFIRRRIEHRPNLSKIVDNIGWLFCDQILRMGVGLIVGVWIARYLGPEQFGLFSFATAFVGLFGAIAGLGLQGIVVRDIVRDPSSKEETLGTAAVLQFISGLIAYGLILGIIFWLRPDDALAKALVGILGSMMLFKASEVVVYWFESQVLSKYTVWVQNASFLVFAAIKVGLILNNAPLNAFAWATMAEALMVALLLGVMLGLRGPRLHHLRITLERAKSLLKDSWPLLLSGIAITLNMKIDQVMLGVLADNAQVGIYSVAVRISEVWYFAIGMILASVFPYLAKNHANKSPLINYRWVQAYRLMFWLSFGFAIALSILSDPLVKILFGSDYSAAANVLMIHVWAGVSVAIGSVWSKWILLENKTTIGLYAQILAAFLNIVLNLILIPKEGAIGAAIATLLSYYISALISYGMYKPKDTYGYIATAILIKRYAN
jgi:O-antigen/teichoic acid export membrane protein